MVPCEERSPPYRAAAAIRRVGVVATGYVGSGWVGFFLSRGLQVSVFTRRQESAAKLRDDIVRRSPWRNLENIFRDYLRCRSHTNHSR